MFQAAAVFFAFLLLAPRALAQECLVPILTCKVTSHNDETFDVCAQEPRGVVPVFTFTVDSTLPELSGLTGDYVLAKDFRMNNGSEWRYGYTIRGTRFGPRSNLEISGSYKEQPADDLVMDFAARLGPRKRPKATFRGTFHSATVETSIAFETKMGTGTIECRPAR